MAVDATVDEGVLKVLGEPVRWAIVQRLAVEDLCVCHLVEELGLPQPLVSHHLRSLREAGLVRTEPCGSFTYYLLQRDVLTRLATTIGELGQAPRSPRRRPCA
jgi:ArsR family transcriptional regulator